MIALPNVLQLIVHPSCTCDKLLEDEVVTSWLKAKCNFKGCMVYGGSRLQELSMLDFVVKPCFLCQMLNLSC